MEEIDAQRAERELCVAESKLAGLGRARRGALAPRRRAVDGAPRRHRRARLKRGAGVADSRLRLPARYVSGARAFARSRQWTLRKATRCEVPRLREADRIDY